MLESKEAWQAAREKYGDSNFDENGAEEKIEENRERKDAVQQDGEE